MNPESATPTFWRLPDEATTSRLSLRRFRAGDGEALHRVCSGPENMVFIGEVDKTIGDTERRIARFDSQWQDLGRGVYGVWAAMTLVGWCGVFRLPHFPVDELGYMLAIEARGRGFATEACIGVRSLWLTGAPSDSSLVSLIHPHNQSSVNVVVRLGATRLGYAPALPGAPDVYGHRVAGDLHWVTPAPTPYGTDAAQRITSRLARRLRTFGRSS